MSSANQQNKNTNTETRLQFNSNSNNVAESKLSSRLESIEKDTQMDRGEVYLMYRNSFSDEVAGVTALLVGYGSHNGMNTQTAETNTDSEVDIVLLSEETTPIAPDELLVATTLYDLLNQIELDEAEEIVEPIDESLPESVADEVEVVAESDKLEDEVPVAAFAVGGGAAALVLSEKEETETESTEDATEKTAVEETMDALHVVDEVSASTEEEDVEEIDAFEHEQLEISIEEIVDDGEEAVADVKVAKVEPAVVQLVEEVANVIAAGEPAEPAAEELVVGDALAIDESIEVDTEDVTVEKFNAEATEAKEDSVLSYDETIVSEVVVGDSKVDTVEVDEEAAIGVLEVTSVQQEDINKETEDEIIKTEVDTAQDVDTDFEAFEEATEADVAEEEASSEPVIKEVASSETGEELHEAETDTIRVCVVDETTEENTADVEEPAMVDTTVDETVNEIVEEAVEAATEDDISSSINHEKSAIASANVKSEVATPKTSDVTSEMPTIVASLAAGACLVAGGVAVTQMSTSAEAEKADVIEQEEETAVKDAAPVSETFIEDTAVVADVVSANVVVMALPVAEVIPIANAVAVAEQVETSEEAAAESTDAVVEAEETIAPIALVETEAVEEESTSASNEVVEQEEEAEQENTFASPVNDVTSDMPQIVASMALGAIATVTIIEKSTSEGETTNTIETAVDDASTFEEIVLSDSEEAVIDEMIDATVEDVLIITSSEERRGSLTLDADEAVKSATEDLYMEDAEEIANQSEAEQFTDEDPVVEQLPVDEETPGDIELVVAVAADLCSEIEAEDSESAVVEGPVCDEAAVVSISEDLDVEQTRVDAVDDEDEIAEPELAVDEAVVEVAADELEIEELTEDIVTEETGTKELPMEVVAGKESVVEELAVEEPVQEVVASKQVVDELDVEDITTKTTELDCPTEEPAIGMEVASEEPADEVAGASAELVEDAATEEVTSFAVEEALTEELADDDAIVEAELETIEELAAEERVDEADETGIVDAAVMKPTETTNLEEDAVEDVAEETIATETTEEALVSGVVSEEAEAEEPAEEEENDVEEMTPEEKDESELVNDQLPTTEAVTEPIEVAISNESEAVEPSIVETADKDVVQDCKPSLETEEEEEEEEVTKAPSSGGWFKKMLFRNKSMPKSSPTPKKEEEVESIAETVIDSDAACVHVEVDADGRHHDTQIAETVLEGSATIPQDTFQDGRSGAVETMENVASEIEHQKDVSQVSIDQEVTLKDEAESISDTDSAVETKLDGEVEDEAVPVETVVENESVKEELVEPAVEETAEEAVVSVEKSAEVEPIELQEVASAEKQAVESVEEDSADSEHVVEAAEFAEDVPVEAKTVEEETEIVNEDITVEAESTVENETVAAEVNEDEPEALEDETVIDAPIDTACNVSDEEIIHKVDSEAAVEEIVAEADTVEETVIKNDLAEDSIEETTEAAESSEEEVVAKTEEVDVEDSVVTESTAEEVAADVETITKVDDEEETVAAETEPVVAVEDTEQTETDTAATTEQVDDEPVKQPAEDITPEAEVATESAVVTEAPDVSTVNEAIEVAADEAAVETETTVTTPDTLTVDAADQEPNKEDNIETEVAVEATAASEAVVTPADEAEIAEEPMSSEEVVVEETKEIAADAPVDVEATTPRADAVPEEEPKLDDVVDTPAAVPIDAKVFEEESSKPVETYEVDTKPISAVAMLIGRYEQFAASATNSRTSSRHSSRVASPLSSPPSSRLRRNVFETAANSIEASEAADKSVEELQHVEPIKEDAEAEVAEETPEATMVDSDEKTAEAEVAPVGGVAVVAEMEDETQDAPSVSAENELAAPEEITEEEALAAAVEMEEIVPGDDAETATSAPVTDENAVEEDTADIATEEATAVEEPSADEAEPVDEVIEAVPVAQPVDEVVEAETIPDGVASETPAEAGMVAPDATEPEANIGEETADEIPVEEVAEAAVETAPESHESGESSILAGEAHEDSIPQDDAEDSPASEEAADAEPTEQQSITEIDEPAVTTADFTTTETIEVYVPAEDAETNNQPEEDPSDLASATNETHFAHEESKESSDNQIEETTSRRMSSISPEAPAVQIDDAAVTDEATAKATVEMAPTSQATKAVADDSTEAENTPERDSNQLLPHEHLTYEILGVTRAHNVIMYHIYTVNSVNGERSTSIPKRYSEFKLLDEQLRTLDIPATKELPVLPKPSVGSFLRGRRSKKTIELREKAFGDFLHFITQHEELHECAVFQLFIDN